MAAVERRSLVGRIRTIKPELLTDEKMKAASDEARVLATALILLSDDYGNGEAGDLVIAGAVWSTREPLEALAKASRAIREVVDMGFEILRTESHWPAQEQIWRPSRRGDTRGQHKAVRESVLTVVWRRKMRVFLHLAHSRRNETPRRRPWCSARLYCSVRAFAKVRSEPAQPAHSSAARRDSFQTERQRLLRPPCAFAEHHHASPETVAAFESPQSAAP